MATGWHSSFVYLWHRSAVGAGKLSYSSRAMIKVEIRRKNWIRISQTTSGAGWFEMEIFKHLVSTRRFLATDIFADVTFDPHARPRRKSGLRESALRRRRRRQNEGRGRFNFELCAGFRVNFSLSGCETEIFIWSSARRQSANERRMSGDRPVTFGWKLPASFAVVKSSDLSYFSCFVSEDWCF